jgi:hypothetical protein
MLGALNFQHPLPTAVGMPGQTGKKALVAAAQLLQHCHRDGGVHGLRRVLFRNWFRLGIALQGLTARFRLDDGSNGRNAYKPSEAAL